jgi:hypothetical protein
MKNGRKIQRQDSSFRFARVETILTQWCREVQGEVEEAVSILDGNSFEGIWWARQIRGNITSTGGPGAVVSGSGAMDKPETLIEIAFWSGWLKGESETLELALGLVSSLGQDSSVHGKTPGLESYSFSFMPDWSGPKELSLLKEAGREAGILRSALENTEFRPEIDKLSVSLSSAIDGECGLSEFAADSTLAELSSYLRNGSPASLAMLSFNCGILAGICMSGKLADGPGGPGSRRQ